MRKQSTPVDDDVINEGNSILSLYYEYSHGMTCDLCLRYGKFKVL